MSTVPAGVSAADLVPDVIANAWPNSVPNHVVVIFDGLRADGARALHAVHEDGAPPWVVIGMLRAILVDLETRWAHVDWIEDDDEDDEDDDED